MTGLIENCAIRDPADERMSMIHFDSTTCRKKFELTPLIMNDHFCFAIRPKIINLGVQRADISLMTDHPGIIHMIDFSDKFQFNKPIQVFTYSVDEFPSASIPHVLIGDTKNRREIFLASQSISQNLLPHPYDTHCVHHAKITDCYPDCLQERLHIFHRVPYLGLAPLISEDRILSYIDLVNVSIGKAWRQAEKQCRIQCSFRSCSHSYTITHITDERPFKFMRFTFESTSSPINITRAIPAMFLYELVYQLLCSMSFWMGFSFIAMNPVTLRAQVKLRAVKKNWSRE